MAQRLLVLTCPEQEASLGGAEVEVGEFLAFISAENYSWNKERHLYIMIMTYDLIMG